MFGKKTKNVTRMLGAVLFLLALFFIAGYSSYYEKKYFKTEEAQNFVVVLAESYKEASSTFLGLAEIASSTLLTTTTVKFFPQLHIRVPKDAHFVPILMYHHIRDYPHPEEKFSFMAAALSVSPSNFKKQLSWLVEHNYVTITPEQLVKYFKNEISFGDKKPIMLTFDDGYENAYKEALPLLEANKQIGVFYIISSYHGRRGYLGDKEIKELDSKGMVIASHTRRHPNLRKLSATSAMEEMVGSKNDLEKLLGHKILNFAYPYGEYNQADKDMLKKVGYVTAVAINPVFATEKSDLLSLPRVWAFNNVDFSKLLP